MKKIFLFCLVIAFAFTAKISFAQTQITFYTSMGTFVAEMYDTLQPITAGNFIKLVEKNFYDGIIFHRVVKNFVIQGLTRNPVAVNPLFQRGQGVLVHSDFSDVGDAEQANTGCHSCACRNLVYSAVPFKI